VPVQPAGTLFYRAKNFYRRNIWALIYLWDGNLFRFIVKHIHASQVGRTENCNMLIAHVQYIGPDSMASRYAYQISLFDTEHRRNGQKFEGLVTSTLKPLESQCAKEDVFVTTFHQARTYTDPWSNLNFIIQMKKLVDDDGSSTPISAAVSMSTATTSASLNVAEPMDDSSSSSSSSSVASPASVSSSSSTSSTSLPSQVQPVPSFNIQVSTAV
jgi:hypothetical protein